MIYVLSDIHGQQRRFDSILSQINLQPEDVLYVLGDVVDRNPDGIRILNRLRAMPNAKLLLGNHEHMMLKALYYPHEEALHQRRMDHWFRNGGRFTYKQLQTLTTAEQTELFAYLDALPDNVTIVVNGKTFLLAHAAPVDLFEKYGGTYQTEREFALWWRYLHEVTPRPDRTVIFGHTGTHHYQKANPMRIWYGNGIIDIDCGASYPEGGSPVTGQIGRLACLRLDDMKEFYSEEFENDSPAQF